MDMKLPEQRRAPPGASMLHTVLPHASYLVVLAGFTLQCGRNTQTHGLNSAEESWFGAMLNNAFHFQGQLLVILDSNGLCWVPGRRGQSKLGKQ